MRKILTLMLVLFLLCGNVFAEDSLQISDEDLTAGLNEEAQELLPEEAYAKNADLWSSIKEIFLNAFKKSSDSFHEGLRLCGVLLCILILCSVIEMSSAKNRSNILHVAGVLGICCAIMGTFQSMISMASGTVEDISTYGSFLMPALASVTAMSGGVNSATALYAGTVIFTQVLLQLITKLLIPLVYFYLAIAVAEAAVGNDMLSELRDFVGWIITKSLRIILYIFLAYMTITGVIGNTADAAAVKATKAAVSGMIPVVGSILSDASETLLSGASMMKNTVGIFGMLAIFATCLLPILRVGIQYLLLKLTAAVGGTVGAAPHVKLLKEFSKAMGFLLAMCSSGALFLLIGTICFMRVV